MTITGRRLVELRAKRKVTQRKVAEAVNVTESVISKYEIGATDPSIATLKRLAKYYGVDPNNLLGLGDGAASGTDRR